MQRWIVLIALAFALFGCLAWPARAQARSLVWLRLDTHIMVLDNGDLRITETNVIQFIGGPFTFGYRDIDMARLERVLDVRATEVRDAEGDRPLRIQTGYPERGRFRIRYDFAPAFNETRTLKLEYTVIGATRYYLEGDQVYWAGVYAERNGFPVQASRLTVQLPPGALAERVEAYGPPATVTGQGESLIVAEALSAIPSGQEFEIRVQFPHHIISGEAPAWQRAFDQQRDYEENVKPRNNLIFLALALLVMFGGPALAALLWFARGRDPQVGLVADYLTEPPADLSPGMAGVLIDERADMQDVMATLVDLAQRGTLTVREEGWRRWIIARGPNYGQPLRPFEQTLIQALGLTGRAESAQLQKRQQAFYRYLDTIKAGLYAQLIADGYYHHNPEHMRASYRRFGVSALAAAVIWVAVGGLLLRGVADTAVWLSVSLAVTGAAFLLVSGAMPARTRKGAEARARLAAFKRYLTDIQKYVDVRQAGEQFNRYLAYAIAFGLERAWVNTFAATDAPAPAWFTPRRSPFEAGPASLDWPAEERPLIRLAVGRSGAATPGAAGRESDRLDVSGAARAAAEAPTLAAVNQSLGAALARVNSDLIDMFSTAARVFDSRPPSPVVTGIRDTVGGARDLLRDWWERSASSDSSSDDGWRDSGGSDSGFGGWSGGGSSSGGSSGGGGGGFG